MLHSTVPPLTPRRAALCGLLGAFLLPAACGTGNPPTAPQTITPAVFVATYVDLRLAVLGGEEPKRMTDSLRAAVLARHGVTEEDLLDFAKIHGSDPTFMKAVWDSVEERLNATRPGDSAFTVPPARVSTDRPDRKRSSDGKGLPPAE